MGANFPTRVSQARRELAVLGADALLVTHLPNVLYLSGFTGSNAILLVLPDTAHLFTDGRYTIQAHQEAPDVRVHIERKALVDAVGSFLKARTAGRRIGFDPIHLNVSEWSKLKGASGKRVRWKAAAGGGERVGVGEDAGGFGS